MLTKLGALKIAAKKTGLTLDEYQAMLASGLKWCGIGRHFVAKTEFGLNHLKNDGLQPYCRKCTHVKDKQSTKGRPTWNKGIPFSSEARQKMAEAHRGSLNHRWKGGISRKTKIDQQKQLARRAINHAIESGRLPKPATLVCSQCATPAREYHHHNGYTPQHWLDVVPLCSRCNKAAK